MVGFTELDEIEGNGRLFATEGNGTETEYLYEYGFVQNDEYSVQGIRFIVYLESKKKYVPFFADLIKYEDMLKVVMISNNEVAEYKRKGIPEYLIQKISVLLNKKVCSSTSLKSQVSYIYENRVKNAHRYWERLMRLFPNNVFFDKTKGVFVYDNIGKTGKAFFIKESEKEVEGGIARDYAIWGNRTITLKLNEEWDKITFWEDGEILPNCEFLFRDEDEHQKKYLLLRMYAPLTLKKFGLGRAALQFFKEYTKADVYARNIHDKPDDGSHLTENAPAFVRKMIDEGILLNTWDDKGDYEDEAI